MFSGVLSPLAASVWRCPVFFPGFCFLLSFFFFFLFFFVCPGFFCLSCFFCLSWFLSLSCFFLFVLVCFFCSSWSVFFVRPGVFLFVLLISHVSIVLVRLTSTTGLKYVLTAVHMKPFSMIERVRRLGSTDKCPTSMHL